MDRRDIGASVTGPGTVGVATAPVIKARSGGRRRSCNRCSSKKERCDGQEPCQRCVRSGLQCLYATCRTLGRPRNSTQSAKRRAPTASSAPKPSLSGGNAPSSGAPTSKATVSTATAKRMASRGGATIPAKGGPSSSRPGTQKPGGLIAAESLQGAAGQRRVKLRKGSPRGPASDAPAAPPSLPLKRVSMSPSPATGLVGLVQNRFLTCFLEDFSPLYSVLDDATIRLGLINLMTGKVDIDVISSSMSAPLSFPPAKRMARGGTASSDVPEAGTSALVKAASPISRSDRSPSPSTCPSSWNKDDYAINSAVFSAMALGALMLGQQPSEIEEYVATAQASLRVCGALTVTVPNERVAVAQLLLAFISKVAGCDEYDRFIQLARGCNTRLEQRGCRSTVSIRHVLNYRAIIDAMAKPSTTTRIPPPQEARPSQTATSAGGPRVHLEPDLHSPVVPPSPVNVSRNSDDRPLSDMRDGSPESVSGGHAAGDSLGERTSGGSLKGSPASRALLSGGSEISSQRTGVGGSQHYPAGVEAARERRTRRETNPLLMVSDIMSVLSRVPWAMKSDEGSRRIKAELVELRSLLTQEKTLWEERLAALGKSKDATPSESLAVFVLANAFIGLHCALEDFQDLLEHARAVARCILACPGFVRYQVHGFHTALTILRAFGKREEFNALVSGAPTELRCMATKRPLAFDSGDELCTRSVCVMHRKAILALAKKYYGGVDVAVRDAPSRTVSSTTGAPPLTAVANRRVRNGAGCMTGVILTKAAAVGDEELSASSRSTVMRSRAGAAMEMKEDGVRDAAVEKVPSPSGRKTGHGAVLSTSDGVGATHTRPFQPDAMSVELQPIEARRRPREGGQWGSSSSHKKQPSFSHCWASVAQPLKLVGGTSSSTGTDLESAPPSGSLSPPPPFSVSGGVGPCSPNDSSRQPRNSEATLPSYSRLWSECGNTSDGVLSSIILPSATAAERRMMPFPEVLRQARAPLPQSNEDWDSSDGRPPTSIGIITGRRYNVDVWAAARTASIGASGGADRGVESPTSGSGTPFQLPSLRFDGAASAPVWNVNTARSHDVRAVPTPSVRHLRGRSIGRSERDAFVGGTSSPRTSETAPQLTGLQQPSSLALGEAPCSSEGRLMDGGQDSSALPFGGVKTSVAMASPRDSDINERDENMTSSQLWEAVTPSSRIPSESSTSSAGGALLPQSVPPPQIRETTPASWSWTSSPEVATSPAPAPPSAVPPPPSQYVPIASNSSSLSQPVASLSSLTSVTSLPTTAHSTQRSLGSMATWRSNDEALLQGGSSPISIEPRTGGPANVAVGATIDSTSSTSTACSASAPQAILPPALSAGPSRGTARVPVTADGGAGQDDNMLMDLWELMENGDNQESAQ